MIVKGFCQKEGIDFDEIFFSIKMFSIRTVLSLGANLNLKIEQLDVGTTFLHGELDETIYMEQLKGFEVKGEKKLVCKLKKSFLD